MNRVGFPYVSTVGHVFALCAVFWLTGTMHASAAVPQGEWVTTGSPGTDVGPLLTSSVAPPAGRQAWLP